MPERYHLLILSTPRTFLTLTSLPPLRYNSPCWHEHAGVGLSPWFCWRCLSSRHTLYSAVLGLFHSHYLLYPRVPGMGHLFYPGVPDLGHLLYPGVPGRGHLLYPGVAALGHAPLSWRPLCAQRVFCLSTTSCPPTSRATTRQCARPSSPGINHILIPDP